MTKKLKPSFSSQRGVAQLPILIGLLILAITLPIVTRLVQQNQETRGRAAYGEGTVWFLPTNPGPKNIGDSFPVYLLADFGQKEMVGFNIKIEYPANVLTLSNENVHINNAFSESNKIRKEVDQIAGAVYLSYISLEGISSASEISDPWIKLDFTVSSLGSGDIRLINNTEGYPQFQIVGVTTNPDSEIKLQNQSGGEEIKINYNLSPEPTALPTPTSGQPECANNEDCNDNSLCTTDTCVDGSCKYTSISCNANAECNPNTGNCQCSFNTVGNCNNNWNDGCETFLINNEEHCGSCKSACPENYICSQKECLDTGTYPTCLIKNMSNELGVNMNYISTMEDVNTRWDKQDVCKDGNDEGKKIILKSLSPDNNDKCWQYEYHTAGAADNLTIHCTQYKACTIKEISCPQCSVNADFNCDGVVDELDYDIFISHFGEKS